TGALAQGLWEAQSWSWRRVRCPTTGPRALGVHRWRGGVWQTSPPARCGRWAPAPIVSARAATSPRPIWLCRGWGPERNLQTPRLWSWPKTIEGDQCLRGDKATPGDSAQATGWGGIASYLSPALTSVLSLATWG